MNSSGIFNVSELNMIRDAHLAWCMTNNVDPKSALGKEAAAYLLQAFTAGCSSEDQMIVSLDSHIRERASAVQLGSAAIPSSGDTITE